MTKETETDKIEKVAEKSAYERFGKAVQGILIGGFLGLLAWAWSLSTDVAILKSNQITPHDLKELKTELKETIKDGFDKMDKNTLQLDLKTSKQLDDLELRMRALEKK